MYLISGLGNPGLRYVGTRHNLGFEVINEWGKSMGVRLSDRRFHSRNTRTKFQSNEVILLRPLTFMNESGKSVKACVDFYGIQVGDILVVHDDIDLPVGRIKVARSGGGGGHKGVLSTIRHLGTNGFARVKIGIGRPRHGESIEDYVLSPFYSDEKDAIGEMIRLGVRACELFISNGVESAMNTINCQNLTSKEVKS